MKSIIQYITERLDISSDEIKLNKEINSEDKSDARYYHKDDIICGVYSYSSRIVDFYKVVSNSGKTVVLKQIGDKLVSGYWQMGKVIPDESKKVNDVTLRLRINKLNHIKKDYTHFYKWDGKPEEVYSD